jgi:hypothetical protein
MGEEQTAVRKSLKLMELITPFFIVKELEGDITGKTFGINYEDLMESEELVDLLQTEDRVELIKGLCFIICLVTSFFLYNGKSPAPHFALVREGMEMTLKQNPELDLGGQALALNLLEATEGRGASFYLQTYALQEDTAVTIDVIVSLASLFFGLAVADLNREVEEVTDYLHRILDRL